MESLEVCGVLPSYLMCCDRQARDVTLSLGVTVRDSSRKTLVLQGFAMRNLGKSSGDGIRIAGSKGESGRFSGGLYVEGLGECPAGQMQRRLIWEIARVATQLDRRLVSQYGVTGCWVTGV